MADTSKLGTILILAVICVGILLIVLSGISAWQSYQSIAEQGSETGLPVPQPTPGVTTAPNTTTAVPATPAAATATQIGQIPVATTAATAGTPAPQETAAASPAATTFASVPVPATAAPLQAPAADDPVLGTWTGTKPVSMLFVSANGQGTVTFRDDYTGDLSGEFHGAGMDEVFASGFVWTSNGGGSYTGSIGTESMGFTLAGETLTMTINPKKLGLNAMLDMDIPVEMHRV